MKVLITGVGGYIGTSLIRQLCQQGYEVTGIDRFYYGTEPLKRALAGLTNKPRILSGDARQSLESSREVANGHDVIIHLAAFSVDRFCDLNPSVTQTTNYDSAWNWANIARGIGARFLFPSSCSVYGVYGDEVVTEVSPLKPYTLYAETKANIEKFLSTQDDLDWVIMRFSTVFGLSYRMRMDLVLNIMAAAACLKHRVTVNGSGNQWRPLLHVHDICRAIDLIMRDKTNSHEIFNVGDDDLAIQMKNLPSIVQDVIPNVEVQFIPQDDDPRSHNMSSKKFQDRYHFKASFTLADGVSEVKQAILRGNLDTEDPRWRSIPWCAALRKYSGILHEMGTLPKESSDPLSTWKEGFQDISDVL